MKKLYFLFLMTLAIHVNGMFLVKRAAVLKQAVRVVPSYASGAYSTYLEADLKAEDAQEHVLDDLSYQERCLVQEAAIDYWQGNPKAPFNAKSEALRIVACNRKRIEARWEYQQRRCKSGEREQCEGLDAEGQRIFDLLPTFVECACVDGVTNFQRDVCKEVSRLKYLLAQPDEGRKIYAYLKEMRKNEIDVLSQDNKERVQE